MVVAVPRRALKRRSTGVDTRAVTARVSTAALSAPSAAGRHWAGVATADGQTVTAERARELVATASAARRPQLLLAFASPAADPAALARCLQEAAGPVPVVGATTAGEIATTGASGGSVVVAALGGEGISVATSVATGASADLRQAGALAAGAVDAVDGEHRIVLLLADGLVGDLQEVVRGAYDVAGAAVPLVGGCAGDDGLMQCTYVLADGTAHTDVVVGVGLASDTPWGVGVAHGWRRVGEPMLVTSSEGTTVHTLDDAPALDVYLRHLDAPPETTVDAAAFNRWAMCHPLGMSRRSGEEVRFIAGADFASRSLQCIAAVPQSGLVWLMEGDSDSVMDATHVACAQALEALAGRPPVAVLAFDCVARKGVLGEEGMSREVAAITAAAPTAAVAGFYTYGEIARVRGTSGFHNQTLVLLAMA